MSEILYESRAHLPRQGLPWGTTVQQLSITLKPHRHLPDNASQTAEAFSLLHCSCTRGRSILLCDGRRVWCQGVYMALRAAGPMRPVGTLLAHVIRRQSRIQPCTTATAFVIYSHLHLTSSHP